MDLSDSITPKSDQLDAEDLLTGPRLVTIAAVREGPSKEQPVNIYLREFDRPWRPSKTVRRILVAAWGAEASEYTDRRLVIYRDPEVRFGGMAVGGIRVSHMSHIEQRFTIALALTRGKRTPHIIEPLPDEGTPDRRRPEPPTRDRRPAEAAPTAAAIPPASEAGAASPAPPVSDPAEAPVKIAPAQRAAITGEFVRLEVDDLPMRLVYAASLAGVDAIKTPSDLTSQQAADVLAALKGCANRDELEQRANGQEAIGCCDLPPGHKGVCGSENLH